MVTVYMPVKSVMEHVIVCQDVKMRTEMGKMTVKVGHASTFVFTFTCLMFKCESLKY